MFFDPEQWEDEEIFRSVRYGILAEEFLNTDLGKKIISRIKEKHKAAVISLTDFAAGSYNLMVDKDRESVERMLRDLAAPTLVLQELSGLILEGKRSEEIAKLRDAEEN